MGAEYACDPRISSLREAHPSRGAAPVVDSGLYERVARGEHVIEREHQRELPLPASQQHLVLQPRPAIPTTSIPYASLSIPLTPRGDPALRRLVLIPRLRVPRLLQAVHIVAF